MDSPMELPCTSETSSTYGNQRCQRGFTRSYQGWQRLSAYLPAGGNIERTSKAKAPRLIWIPCL